MFCAKLGIMGKVHRWSYYAGAIALWLGQGLEDHGSDSNAATWKYDDPVDVPVIDVATAHASENVTSGP
jgi:hypothetical protein